MKNDQTSRGSVPRGVLFAATGRDIDKINGKDLEIELEGGAFIDKECYDTIRKSIMSHYAIVGNSMVLCDSSGLNRRRGGGQKPSKKPKNKENV